VWRVPRNPSKGWPLPTFLFSLAQLWEWRISLDLRNNLFPSSEVDTSQTYL
jgi:hypothetical protein